MTEYLPLLGMTVVIFIIMICVLLGVYVSVEKIKENIIIANDRKKVKKYKEQGIEEHWAICGHGFYIEKTHNNETFYLNQDGCFYNTTTNIKEFNFDTRDEMSTYIEDNKEIMKSKYGEDANFKIYTKRIYLGYCKQL